MTMWGFAPLLPGGASLLSTPVGGGGGSPGTYPATAADMDVATSLGDWTSATTMGWLFDMASGDALPEYGAVTLLDSGTPVYQATGPLGGADEAVALSVGDRFSGTVFTADSANRTMMAGVATLSATSTGLIELGYLQSTSNFLDVGVSDHEGSLKLYAFGGSTTIDLGAAPFGVPLVWFIGHATGTLYAGYRTLDGVTTVTSWGPSTDYLNGSTTLSIGDSFGAGGVTLTTGAVYVAHSATAMSGIGSTTDVVTLLTSLQTYLTTPAATSAGIINLLLLGCG